MDKIETIKVNKVIKKFLEKMYNKIRIINIYISELKNIFRKRKLIKTTVLQKEQIEKIDNIWVQNYGKKISKYWHRLYMSYTESFDSLYFPEILFTTNLLEKLNPNARKKYLADKILIPYYFNNLEFQKYKVIKNYIYNCNGYFYDDGRNNKL